MYKVIEVLSHATLPNAYFPRFAARFTQGLPGNYPWALPRLALGQLPQKARGSPHALLLPNAAYLLWATNALVRASMLVILE